MDRPQPNAGRTRGNPLRVERLEDRRAPGSLLDLLGDPLLVAGAHPWAVPALRTESAGVPSRHYPASGPVAAVPPTPAAAAPPAAPPARVESHAVPMRLDDWVVGLGGPAVGGPFIGAAPVSAPPAPGSASVPPGPGGPAIAPAVAPAVAGPADVPALASSPSATFLTPTGTGMPGATVTAKATPVSVGGQAAVTPVAPATPATTPPQAPPAQAAAGYGNLPLGFEANVGQADAAVRFVARGNRSALFLTDTEAVLDLRKKSGDGTVLRMAWDGANPAPRVAGDARLPGTVNEFSGSDPAGWRTDIATFGRVVYQGVYPGTDLVFYGNQRQLEYDFVLAPGADPGKIALRFSGADSVSVNAAGDLVLTTGGETVVERAPVVYQDVGGVRQAVVGSYVVGGDGRVGFRVGDYDRSRPLVIDPVLGYSTYLGGTGYDTGKAVATDAAGNAYVAGMATSTNFPTTAGAYQRSSPTGGAFVTKLNPTGTPIYSTYIAGAGANAVAVDAGGNAYVAGDGGGPTFPSTPGGLRADAGMGGATVVKLNPTGSGLVYTALFGGRFGDIANGIAVDAGGNAVVAGTVSGGGSPTGPAFPTVNAFQPNYGGGTNDAFVAKLNAAGTALVYSTYLGGGTTGIPYSAVDDWGTGIAVDPAGNAYATGYTFSFDFPTTPGAYKPSANGVGGLDAFVTKFTPSGAVAYSTLLGGSGRDQANGIAVDAAGSAYVTGYTVGGLATTPPNPFPTTPGAFQSGLDNGSPKAFVTKLNPAGSGLAYSTLVGADGLSTRGWAIAVDSSGSTAIVGDADGPGLPTYRAAQAAYGGGLSDAFVTKLDPTGSAPVFSTYLGGNLSEIGRGVAVDRSGNVIVTGDTDSLNFPTTAGAFRPRNAGGLNDQTDAFVTKINNPGPATSWLTTFSLSPSVVDAGGSSVGTVTLNAPAPAGGTAVALTNPRPDIATLPASVIVPAGATAASFTITTSTSLGGWTGQAGDQITARAGGVPRAQTLSVNYGANSGVTASSVTFDPASVTAGQTSTATVTLSGPAPAGGAVVTLQSGDPAVGTVPASVTVPAGATSATFPVTTLSTPYPTWLNVFATYGGVTANGALLVNPAAASVVTSITLNPTSLTGGQSATAIVTLDGPAAAGGVVVSLASANPAVASLPATVTVPAGSTGAVVTVTTQAVTAATSVALSASFGGATVSATLTVNPAPAVTLTAVTLNPSTVTGGQSTTGTVTLSAPAPAGGVVVTVASGTPGVAMVPATVTVPAGATSATFPVTTQAVLQFTLVQIYATYNGVTLSATLTVNRIFDTVSVTRAEYTRSTRQLRVEAASTGTNPILKVYVAATGQLVGTLTNLGGGRYGGQFAWPSNPVTVTVGSSLGGTATKAVTLR